MVAQFKLDERMMDIVRRGMCTKRTEADMAQELGVSVRTIASAKRRIRAAWAKSALDVDKELSEIYGRLQYLEDAAFKDRRWREARECLALRMRLTAAARPERKAVEMTGAGGGPIATRTEIVVVDPQSPSAATATPVLDAAALLPLIVAVDPQCPPQ